VVPARGLRPCEHSQPGRAFSRPVVADRGVAEQASLELAVKELAHVAEKAIPWDTLKHDTGSSHLRSP